MASLLWVARQGGANLSFNTMAFVELSAACAVLVGVYHQFSVEGVILVSALLLAGRYQSKMYAMAMVSAFLFLMPAVIMHQATFHAVVSCYALMVGAMLGSWLILSVLSDYSLRQGRLDYAIFSLDHQSYQISWSKTWSALFIVLASLSGSLFLSEFWAIAMMGVVLLFLFAMRRQNPQELLIIIMLLMLFLGGVHAYVWG